MFTLPPSCLAAAVLAFGGLAACVAAPPPGQQPVTLRGGGPSVTVTAAVPAKAAVASGQLSIRVAGILPERNELVRFRVFIDHPDATAKTDPSNERCAGEITLLPAAGKSAGARNSILAMPSKWMSGAASAKVTLVPLSSTPVRIQSVEIIPPE